MKIFKMVKIKNKKQTFYRNQKGASTIEFIFCFIVYCFAVALLYGSFGVVHSSILNSIGARTYAFSIIRNRSDISFAKDTRIGSNSDNAFNYYSPKQPPPPEGIEGIDGTGPRFFGITTNQPTHALGSDGPDWIMPSLAMDFVSHRNQQVQIVPAQGGGIMALNLNDIDDPDDDFEPGQGLQPGASFSQDTLSAVVNQRLGYGICLNASCN